MRLEAQRKETTLSRVESFLEAVSKMLSPKPGVPSPFDIALDIPMVREIIEQPVEVEVTQSSFEPIQHLLPAFVVQWQQNAKAGFADLVRSRVDLPPDVDPLSLAVGTYFKCGHCYRAWFTYEEAFEHDCQHQDISQLFRWETDPLKVALLSARRAWGRMWRPGCFVAIGAMVQSIAKLIGKDPTRVTAAELDESPLRFACKGCDTRSHFASAVTVFGWRQICQHVVRLLCSKDQSIDSQLTFVSHRSVDLVTMKVCMSSRTLSPPRRSRANQRLKQANLFASNWCMSGTGKTISVCTAIVISKNCRRRNAMKSYNMSKTSPFTT